MVRIADFSDEVDGVPKNTPTDVNSYRNAFNKLPSVQDSNLRLVSATLDTIKSYSLYTLIAIFILFSAGVYIFYNSHINPSITNVFNTSNLINSSVKVDNNYSITPIIYVNINQTFITFYNSSYVNNTIITYFNNSFINDSLENNSNESV